MWTWCSIYSLFLLKNLCVYVCTSAHVCMFWCVSGQVLVFKWVCACHRTYGGQRTTRSVSPHCPPHMRRILLVIYCVFARLVGLWVSGDFPVPIFHFTIGALALLRYAVSPAFQWVLGIWTDVLTSIRLHMLLFGLLFTLPEHRSELQPCHLLWVLRHSMGSSSCPFTSPSITSSVYNARLSFLC